MREKYFLRLHIILYINKQTNELTKNKEVVRDRVKSGFVTEQMGGGSRYIITEKIPPFCLWRFPPTHTPARFKMPAARGKTSLNARDW